jgi:hypothetical protein
MLRVPQGTMVTCNDFVLTGRPRVETEGALLIITDNTLTEPSTDVFDVQQRINASGTQLPQLPLLSTDQLDDLIKRINNSVIPPPIKSNADQYWSLPSTMSTVSVSLSAAIGVIVIVLLVLFVLWKQPCRQREHGTANSQMAVIVPQAPATQTESIPLEEYYRHNLLRKSGQHH